MKKRRAIVIVAALLLLLVMIGVSMPSGVTSVDVVDVVDGESADTGEASSGAFSTISPEGVVVAQEEPTPTPTPDAQADAVQDDGRILVTPAVEYHTADEILTMYHLMGLDTTVGIAYAQQPDVAGLTSSGALTDEVQINALNTLNFARYIAGLSYDVALSKSYIQYAQDGAVALAAIGGGVNHFFEQPSWMSDSFYQSASIGTANSNLSAGISNLAVNIIHGWLSDEGENNLAALGHRRIALMPDMQATGFGFAYATSGTYSCYSSMSTLGVSQGEGLGVMWPAQTMPVEYFASNYPWSFSPGSPVATDTEVTITRENDGATWYIKDDFLLGSIGDGTITINNDYYGQPGCIIFMPADITYSAGDVYNVEIKYTTTNHFTVQYTVEFFSLSDEYEPQAHVTVPELVVVE